MDNRPQRAQLLYIAATRILQYKASVCLPDPTINSIYMHTHLIMVLTLHSFENTS